MDAMKARLLARLAPIEGLEARPSPVAGGTALFFRGKEIAHFHDDHEIDVHLSRQLITALGLLRPPPSAQHPDRAPSSPWIELRIDTEADVERVAQVIERAIAPFPPGRPARAARA